MSETKEPGMTEQELLLADLRELAEGERRRLLIIDSQIERHELAIRRVEAVAAALEAQLAILADLDRLDVQIKKLNTAVLKEAAPGTTEQGQPNKKDRARNGITVNYS